MTELSMEARTDLIFHREAGTVLDRGEYVFIETPASPNYYFGNLLFFKRPPGAGDFDRWCEAFHREFAHRPGVRHVTFKWDVRAGPTGDVEPFLQAGFEFDSNVVLLAERVSPPPKVNAEVGVHRIATDGDWAAVIENQVRGRHPWWPEDVFREFFAGQVEIYRGLEQDGRGGWYGAYLDGQLVADLGLFRDGDVGRFQRVGTHPDFRRRGICGTLVYEVSRRALEEQNLRTLVMVADEHYHAARIYESVGFEAKEKSAAVCLRPPKVNFA
jgi:RimJ/RimL family protein N-acetyltransferase